MTFIILFIFSGTHAFCRTHPKNSHRVTIRGGVLPALGGGISVVPWRYKNTVDQQTAIDAIQPS